MKRFLIFVSAHLFLFLLVIAYQAQADHEEWTIDKYETLSYARVSGEVTHGDSLNFFAILVIILSRETLAIIDAAEIDGIFLSPLLPAQFA